MAPPCKFKYDLIQLINCVRERPCLWDKTLENYKDRIERKNAWEEIFNILDDQYEEMSWEDKRITGELIQNKWTNVRDTFVKSLKTRCGKPKRKYLLYDHLKFLLKVTTDEDICTDYIEDQTQQDYNQESSFFKHENEEPSTSYSAPKKPKRKHREKKTVAKSEKKSQDERKSDDSDYETYDYDDSLNFLEVDPKVESDPRLMNEDEAFFASLLPTVVKYNQRQRLLFRMEVLKVMKKIMDLDSKTWNEDD